MGGDEDIAGTGATLVVGAEVSVGVGAVVAGAGATVAVGAAVGAGDGAVVAGAGVAVGVAVGAGDGPGVMGPGVTLPVGAIVSAGVGTAVTGPGVTIAVGIGVGSGEGAGVGTGVSSTVGAGVSPMGWGSACTTASHGRNSGSEELSGKTDSVGVRYLVSTFRPRSSLIPDTIDHKENALDAFSAIQQQEGCLVTTHLNHSVSNRLCMPLSLRAKLT